MGNAFETVVREEDNDRLGQTDENSILRFLTCGSVDDGKSTLIGRLLYDAKLILDDQLMTLERESRERGSTKGEIDFALLVDGLEAEREQGITIDIAYRFFATARRKFIVADAPGHEEYTRNMVTGASTANLAVVLVDSRQGIVSQTRRHCYVAALLGIRKIVLAVNKMDLVGYDQLVFEKIIADFKVMAINLGFSSFQPIPLSARYGDNVTRSSQNTRWYDGPHLLEYLETVAIEREEEQKPFRFPVQYVSRPNSDFRGFSGQIASGSIAVGDRVTIVKSGRTSTIKEIVTYDGSLARAGVGQAVTLLLDDHLDVSRGNMLASSQDPPSFSDQFQAHIVWFDATPMMPGRSYVLQTETDSVSATVTALKYQVDVNSFAHIAAKALHMNEVGVCNISTRSPIAFDAYAENRATGSFILIDRFTNNTIGAGTIDYGLKRSENVRWQKLDVDRAARAALMHQKPTVIWFTGLSGSGKSTVANSLEKLLHAKGHHTYLLDGDNVRHGLSRDLGFTDEDRVENIRRAAEVARLMADAGLIVLVCFISPFASERRLARDLMMAGEFIEVFIDTPLDECMRRDPKGLYAKAIAGQIPNFTGISSPYEPPENPELHLKTINAHADDLAMEILVALDRR